MCPVDVKPITGNALHLLQARYLLRDSSGHLTEDPSGMFHRVATAVAEAEHRYGDKDTADQWGEHFYQCMLQRDFLPNSPTLMYAGTGKGQLSACFVLPLEDSIDGIFETLKQTARIHQAGGGTGFDFSSIRAAGAPVAGAGGGASGPVSILTLYNQSTEHLRQGGRRRGANMGVLRVDHPDIEAFIQAKRKQGSLRHFNLSVGVSHSFMTAVVRQADWILRRPQDGEPVRTVKAQAIWQLLLEQAWSTGDPGLLFLDTINQKHALRSLGWIAATNPCGEVPLLPFESCNLGSVNLVHMLDRTQKFGIDWPRLHATVQTGIRFLDNVLDVNDYLLPEIARSTLASRKIGLGVMGWAEMLMALAIPYASAKAVRLAEEVMRFVHQVSVQTSHQLALERGTFPHWGKSCFYPDRPMRNATVNSIAPTGSISIIAGTTSSIEPLYGLSFRRHHVLGGEAMTEVDPVFLDQMQAQQLWTPELDQHVKTQGSLAGTAVSPALKKLFATSLEVPYSFHLRHQLAFQKYTDNAVSKTINLPASATIEDVDHIFKIAWKEGAKGITIYRDGCRRDQALQQGCCLG